MAYPKVDFLYLNEEDMVRAGVKDMAGCIDAMEEMFKLMKVGDYRMGGANGNSHGCMVMFPPSLRFRRCQLMVQTADLWQCRHIWAVCSIWQG